MIDQSFRNINRLFELSLKNDNDDPRINSSDEYYMPLVEIKDFNALIDNKPFFDEPVINKQEAYEIQETMVTQLEISWNICMIKNIINLLILMFFTAEKLQKTILNIFLGSLIVTQ